MKKFFSSSESRSVSHGGNLLSFASRYGIKPDEIIDFSSNINPLGFPESVEALYRNSFKSIRRYPNPYAERLCQKISEIFAAPLESIVSGNGSLALLQSAIRTLKPHSALLIEPCFGEYRRILSQTGARIETLFLKAEESFAFPLDKIKSYLGKVELILLGHPNNPTGTALSREGLLNLLAAANKSGTSLILDEAFVDWMPERSLADIAGHNENILVIRSMTKFYALAGLRVGYAIGDRQWIRAMKAYLGPWNTSELAETLSLALLEDAAFQAKSRNWFQQENAWFQKTLENLNRFKVFPSLANFHLLQSEMSLEGLIDFLAQKRIYIRPANNFPGLNDRFIRVALKTRQENEFFIQSLSQISLPSLRGSVALRQAQGGERSRTTTEAISRIKF